MPRVVISAVRRGLAALVLFLGVLAALDAALFKVWHSVWGDAAISHPVACHPATELCYSTRPGWAIPVAVAVGLAGILLAAFIYRPRPTTR
jgi:hypothetical protein